MIQCQALSKSFGSTLAVSNVDLQLEANQVVGLLGRNGSGKSTLMKLIAGLASPSEGALSISGMPPQKFRRRLAYVGDYLGFYPWMTTRDVEQLMAALFDDFDIKQFRSLVSDLDIPKHQMDKMSKGQQQKLKLTAAMARQAQLFLLDEPLSGIDILTRNEILNHLIQNRTEGSLVIITTHEIKDVEGSLQHGIFMKDGRKVLDATADRITKQGLTISEAFIKVLSKNEETTL